MLLVPIVLLVAAQAKLPVYRRPHDEGQERVDLQPRDEQHDRDDAEQGGEDQLAASHPGAGGAWDCASTVVTSATVTIGCSWGAAWLPGTVCPGRLCS